MNKMKEKKTKQQPREYNRIEQAIVVWEGNGAHFSALFFSHLFYSFVLYYRIT